MDNRELLSFIGMIFFLCSLVFLSIFLNKNDLTYKHDEKKTSDNEIHWGVDSANYTDKEMVKCVKDNLGNPTIWGRYLGDKEGVSSGIDKDEVKLLHDKDVSILIIYNHFTEATGHENGKEAAKEAISLAKDLDIPEDVAIFGDVEPKYPVDSAFLDGWYETLEDSKYAPGLYGVFDEESKLMEAFLDTDDKVQEDMILWTAHPQEGITSKDDAPEFEPDGPEDANVYGWQYGQDDEKCNVDTNLFKDEVNKYLWSK